MEHARILVLGGSGYVGAEVVRRTPANTAIWSTYRDHPRAHANAHELRVDLFDNTSLRDAFEVCRLKTVIHVARLGVADADSERAGEVTRRLIQDIQDFGAALLYLSSDAVFDGQRGDYAPNDAPQPITDYGRAKVAAEQAIRESTVRSLIIRVDYIYGDGAGGTDKRTRTLVAQALRGEPIEQYTDMIRSPIHVTDLALTIWSLVREGRTGIMHLCESKQSVYTFTRMLATRSGLDPSIVRPISLQERRDGEMIAADTSLRT